MDAILREVVLNGAVSNDAFLKQLFQSLPYLTSIVNSKREIVFANDTYLKTLGINSLEQILGLRPGEVMNCIESNENGCGKGKHCQNCSIARGVDDCILTGESKSFDTSIQQNTSQGVQVLELSINLQLFQSSGVKLCLVLIENVAHKKKKQIIEKIFYHDLINKVGSLHNIISYIRTQNDMDDTLKHDFVELAHTLVNDITDEVKMHKEIIQYENAEITANMRFLLSGIILEQISEQMRHHPVAKGKSIVVKSADIDLCFQSDSVLLKRVLTNMVKNALEAVGSDAIITLGAFEENHKIVFYVHNPSYIPEEIQKYIFKKSFSTKASSRGLGTHSMKILTEEYLKGEIDFVSKNDEGTTFFVRLNK